MVFPFHQHLCDVRILPKPVCHASYFSWRGPRRLYNEVKRNHVGVLLDLLADSPAVPAGTIALTAPTDGRLASTLVAGTKVLAGEGYGNANLDWLSSGAHRSCRRAVGSRCATNALGLRKKWRQECAR